MIGLRAIIVSVDYSDLLALTLPRNRKHFDEVCVVTSSADDRTVEIAKTNDAKIFQTDSMYKNGAVFNKWLALEEGWDWFGRKDWCCHLDADIVWPDVIPDLYPIPRGNYAGITNYLCSPLRRMMTDISKLAETGIPSEPEWKNFPVHQNVNEWAGYTQIFHAYCPFLGSSPWHETDWKHAGGADSMFQAKWPSQFKIRPSWEVLHLGPAGKNWMGRATDYVDGTKPELAKERLEMVSQIWKGRQGKTGQDRFRDEKIPTSS